MSSYKKKVSRIRTSNTKAGKNFGGSCRYRYTDSL